MVPMSFFCQSTENRVSASVTLSTPKKQHNISILKAINEAVKEKFNDGLEHKLNVAYKY